jgi:uncharacterized membrane protein YbhN (UPF0104 family)
LLGGAGLGAAVLASALACALGAWGSGLLLGRGRIAERALRALAAAPLGALRELARSSRARFTSTDRELEQYFAGSRLAAALPALAFLAGWVLEAVETYVILRLLGVELPFAAVGALEVTLSFVRHLTFLLPAGLGVQDLGYVAFLRAGGVSDALAVGAAFVLAKRAKEVAWALIGYALLSADLRGRRAPPSPLLVAPAISSSGS